MFRSVLYGIVLCALVPLAAQEGRSSAQGRNERDEVRALVFEYTRLEDAGDMEAQGRLMAPDRLWHGPGGRRTDNVLWMKVQAESMANNRQRFPGVRFVREVRDLEIRVLAPTVALASFTWFANRIVPSNLPADARQALGPPPIPAIVSLVSVKGSDGWKIVSSHHSPMYVLP